jgi:hypothetical protein
VEVRVKLMPPLPLAGGSNAKESVRVQHPRCAESMLLSAHHLASMGKIQGTLCISGPINLRNANPVIAHSTRGLRSAVSLNLCS